MRILFFILPSLWYPLRHFYGLRDNQINTCHFNNEKLVVYKNSTASKYICHTDTCPHQGASLSQGKLTKNCEIICPYHGFCFNSKGQFLGIDNHIETKPDKRKKQNYIEQIETNNFDNMLFIRRIDPNFTLSEKIATESLYEPPEKHDSRFSVIRGSRWIDTNYLSVVENLLDMTHISFVHSFGSSLSLPTSINYQKISHIHGKTTFHYNPNPASISNMLDTSNQFSNTSVIVENEYILPTTTITRVFFGKNKQNIKTVFTRCVPLSENKTILYWYVYRNYWNDNKMVTKLGDLTMDALMESVLNEDIQILKHVDPKSREGELQTKFDITILKFRQSMKTVDKT